MASAKDRARGDVAAQSADAFRASHVAQIEELERQMQKWIAAGRAKREHLWKTIAGNRASPRSLDNLTALIESFERNRIADAEDLARQEKALLRDHKLAAKLSKASVEALTE